MLSRKILFDFSVKYPDARAPLTRWWTICQRNNFPSFRELEETFGTADMVSRCVIFKTKKDYERALESMEAVFDAKKGPLADYAETLTILIEHYEEELYPIKEAAGVDVLKFLMEQNNLKQKDLIRILGSKSAVSEILSGKRPLNLNHIIKLAEKFHVKPATFL